MCLVKLDLLIFESPSYCFKDHFTIEKHSLKMLSSRTWTHHQSVSVPNNPRCLRNIGTHLYQCHGNGITVYDTRLNQLNSIPSCDTGNVYDVCDMSNGDLLIATSYGLYHTGANGNHRQQYHKISQSTFISLFILNYIYVFSLPTLCVIVAISIPFSISLISIGMVSKCVYSIIHIYFYKRKSAVTKV